MIYLTHFADLRNLPPNITPVSICAEAPEGWEGLQYKKLAPNYQDLQQYKATGNAELFISNYRSHTLEELLPSNIVQEIHVMAGAGDIALVCHEKPSSFCYCHLVGAWLEKAGYVVKEYQERAS